MFYLKTLKLTNFRCYDDYKIDFSEKTNIIVGNNATGKTSLVEAIYFLGVAKSHKARSDDELIKHSKAFSTIKGYFEKDGSMDEVLFSISEESKKITKNSKIIRSVSEYLGYFNAVIFCPEDVGLINGAPVTRRRFLDLNIGQINPKYLKSAISYRKVLRQRNELLKQFNNSKDYNEELLKILTDGLIKEAKTLILERNAFILKLNEYLIDKCYVISGAKDEAKIVYLPNCSVENIEKEAKQRESLDKFKKTTTWGPHRDDFIVHINDKDSSKYASQGQQKTLALSIKLGVADLIKELNSNIIIILDDVFGELDKIRQNRLLELLEMENQIFITTTATDFLSEDVLNNSKKILIGDGE